MVYNFKIRTKSNRSLFLFRRNSYETTDTNKKSKFNIFCGKRKKKMRNRLPKNNLVYEKVTLFYPSKTFKRPIVLIGATNLGIFELRKMLIQNERLATAVPHTTRRKLLEEIDGN